ncbi:MAG: VacJ family lipoprotein [Deltaproteobacteria bacterium]|nr:VacJ family lipoprotein [Candidatus Tharpella sp.]
MKIEKSSSSRYILGLCLLLLLVSGCATRPAARYDEGTTIFQARKPVSEFVKKDIIHPIDAYDPWECFNREMYKFNYYFDRYLFLPIVGVYEWILPNYVQDRLSGIFNNIEELSNLTNNLLQLKGKGTAITTGRIIVNTTVGLAGMYDPAKKWGMPEYDEDFGQTLGYYGVGPGPYLVLPVLGPSSLRDTTGLAVDATVRYLFWDWLWDDGPFENVSGGNESKIRWSLATIEAIAARHQIDFRYYQSGSPFEYDFVRKIYLEKRKIDVAK